MAEIVFSSLPLPFAFSAKAFTRGLIADAVILIVMLALTLLVADYTVDSLRARLPGKSVSIDRSVLEDQRDSASVTETPVHVPSETPPPEVAPVDPGPAYEGGIAANTMPEAPIEGLTENSEFGTLPRIRESDGLKPFDAYKKPFNAIPGRPRIALAVMDMGLSERATEAAISSLPPSVSLVVNPYAQNLDDWQKQAHAAGHEIWLKVPLEMRAVDSDAAGPSALRLASSIQQNEQTMDWILSRAMGYAGIVSNEEHAFRDENLSSQPLITEAAARGLAFVEVNPVKEGFARGQAIQLGVPYGSSKAWLDEDPDADAIVRKLQELELAARKEGTAIGMMRPYPVSYQVVLKWLDTLEDKGIDITPLSAALE